MSFQGSLTILADDHGGSGPALTYTFKTQEAALAFAYDATMEYPHAEVSLSDKTVTVESEKTA